MDKYVSSNAEELKIEKIYDSIPSQLLNSSNKFQFSKIVSGAKSRDYETALDWLLASSMILKSDLVSVPEIPLKGFVKNEYFKLFLKADKATPWAWLPAEQAITPRCFSSAESFVIL